MQNNDKYLAILILIGGKSTRFGIEKPIVELLEKPLILHQIETLSKIDNDIYLVAHSEEQIYRYRKEIKFPKDVNFIIDDRELFTHLNLFRPMLGVYSGLKELYDLGFEKAFLLSCDMPLINHEVIELMIVESKEYDSCIPRWNNGYLEPFFAIYPVKEGFKKAKEILTTENFGILNFIDKYWKINYISVEKSIQPLDKHLLSLINVNGPIDLLKLVRLYNQ